MPTSTAHCPLCQNESNDIVETFDSLTILRCSECTLEFCDPLEYCREDYDRAYKEESREFYVPSSAWLSESARSLPESQWMLFSAQVSALRWIQSSRPDASILDIGCGSGWFLARAKQLGFKVCGIDVGSRPVRLLKEKGFESEGILGYRHRAKEIVRIVKEEKADMLVAGAHGHTGIKDIIYGETINTVRHELKIPVLIVHL